MFRNKTKQKRVNCFTTKTIKAQIYNKTVIRVWNWINKTGAFKHMQWQYTDSDTLLPGIQLFPRCFFSLLVHRIWWHTGNLLWNVTVISNTLRTWIFLSSLCTCHLHIIQNQTLFFFRQVPCCNCKLCQLFAAHHKMAKLGLGYLAFFPVFFFL